MDADEIDGGGGEGPVHGLAGHPGGDREAELGVVMAGGHVLMGLGLDPGGDPEQHLGGGAAGGAQAGGGQGVEPVELVETVDHDAAHPGLDGLAQLIDRLVVAVEHQPVGGDPSAETDMELSPAGHVDTETLLVGQAGHGPAEEGLGGVDGARAEGGIGLGTTGPKVVLVVDEEGGAELVGQVEGVAAPDEELAAGADGGILG